MKHCPVALMGRKPYWNFAFSVRVYSTKAPWMQLVSFDPCQVRMAVRTGRM